MYVVAVEYQFLIIELDKITTTVFIAKVSVCLNRVGN